MALALIVAAGRGERLGSEGPKALVDLGGRPLLQWSVDVLCACEPIEQVVVALPAGVSAPEGTIGTKGGSVRSLSVRNALQACGRGDPVLIHDAARPFLTDALVLEVLAAMDDPSVDGAVAAAPLTDTVKRAGSDRVVAETLERSSLWAAQTPQAFRREVLERALDVPEEVLGQATDDSWLVERAGGRVLIVEAPRENMKVTSKVDLELARMLIARGPA